MISKQFPAKIFIIQSTYTHTHEKINGKRSTDKIKPAAAIVCQRGSDAGVAAVPLTSVGRG